ncbi:MAG: hypothetical protein JWO16_1925 [Sphingomonas bacterium]|nr:hypothetical protein [Sphingomonas bacterium]
MRRLGPQLPRFPPWREGLLHALATFVRAPEPTHGKVTHSQVSAKRPSDRHVSLIALSRENRQLYIGIKRIRTLSHVWR